MMTHHSMNQNNLAAPMRCAELLHMEIHTIPNVHASTIFNYDPIPFHRISLATCLLDFKCLRGPALDQCSIHSQNRTASSRHRHCAIPLRFNFWLNLGTMRSTHCRAAGIYALPNLRRRKSCCAVTPRLFFRRRHLLSTSFSKRPA